MGASRACSPSWHKLTVELETVVRYNHPDDGTFLGAYGPVVQLRVQSLFVSLHWRLQDLLCDDAAADLQKSSILPSDIVLTVNHFSIVVSVSV